MQSKYIDSLLEKAKRREQEREIVFERKLAKDRAKEDAEFGDKEKFVTRAYREKLEERKKWLAEEKRREAIEAANDVSNTAGRLLQLCVLAAHTSMPTSEILERARLSAGIFRLLLLPWCRSQLRPFAAALFLPGQVTKRADLSDLYRNLFHARTKRDDAAQPKEAERSTRPEAGKRGGTEKPEGTSKPARSSEERGRRQEEGGRRAQDSEEPLTREDGKQGGLSEGPRGVKEGIAMDAAPARGLEPFASSRDDEEDEEGARRGSTSQGTVQSSRGTGVVPEGGSGDASAPAQPPKERVTAGSLSAAKERYLSRKKQRTEAPS